MGWWQIFHSVQLLDSLCTRRQHLQRDTHSISVGVFHRAQCCSLLCSWISGSQMISKHLPVCVECTCLSKISVMTMPFDIHRRKANNVSCNKSVSSEFWIFRDGIHFACYSCNLWTVRLPTSRWRCVVVLGPCDYITACCSPSPLPTWAPPPFPEKKTLVQSSARDSKLLDNEPQFSTFNHVCLVMIIDHH